MTRCPKCESTQIIGPRYVLGYFGIDSLEYTCFRCGYKKEEPCKDAKKS